MPFLDFIYLANDTSGDGENVCLLIKAWFSIMPAPSGRFISCVLRAEFSSHLVLYHRIEPDAVLGARTGDALVGVDPDEFPPEVRLNHLRVVVNLGLVGR